MQGSSPVGIGANAGGTLLRLLRSRRNLIALLAVVVAVQAGVIAHRRMTHLGDFDVSREFGRRVLAGEPLYAGGLHYPYMPTAALYFAPLAWLPPGLGLAVRYAAALACLWLTLRMLHTMVSARSPALAGDAVGLAGLTLAFASHYVLRDLDDGGPHIILLAMVVGGMYALWRGRSAAAAAWFGLAAALKAPNALFLAYFAWKRQWRLAALSSAALLAWMVLPAVWMGPSAWWQHQGQWLRVALASAVGAPAGGARESEERVQNQALRQVLTRYCSAAIGRSSAVEGAASAAPWPRGSAALQEERSAIADHLPTLGVLTVIALFAWWSRRPLRLVDPMGGAASAAPWPRGSAALDTAQPARARAETVAPVVEGQRERDRWLAEASALLILSVLLAPVAWIQHLVVVIPALYVIAARRRLGELSGAATAAMAVYFVLAILLNREILGRERYLFLLAYGLHTWAMLIVLAGLSPRSRSV